MDKKEFNKLCDLVEVTCIDLVKWNDEKPQFDFLASNFSEKSLTAYFSKKEKTFKIHLNADELYEKKNSAKEFLTYLRKKLEITK